MNIKNDLLLPWISPKDRKIAIDSSKRFILNSLTIKKRSPIKKILKNLKKSRVKSKSKSKKYLLETIKIIHFIIKLLISI